MKPTLEEVLATSIDADAFVSATFPVSSINIQHWLSWRYCPIRSPLGKVPKHFGCDWRGTAAHSHRCNYHRTTRVLEGYLTRKKLVFSILIQRIRYCYLYTMGVSSRRCNDFSIDAIFGTRRVLDHQDYDRLEGASSLQTGVVNQEIEEPRYPTTISECSSPCESSQTNSTAYDQPRTFAYPSSASADVSSVRVRPNTDHHAINPNRIVVVPQGHTYHHVHPTQQIILPCEASYSGKHTNACRKKKLTHQNGFCQVFTEV